MNYWFARVFAVLLFFSPTISRKAFGCESVTSGRSLKWVYTCENIFTDPLFGCSASGTGRNYRTRRASWVTRCYVVISRAAFERIVECVRGVSSTIYLAFRLSCDLGEIVVGVQGITKSQARGKKRVRS